MKTTIQHAMDKAPWGDGPWQTEPDRIKWEDPATGLPCAMVRHAFAGHWCGYVGVPPLHPLFGQEYNSESLPTIAVHGELTFSGLCEDEAIWWFGFDCGHVSFDVSPGYVAALKWAEERPESIPGESLDALRGLYERQGEYRDQAYVEGQVAELARQLATLGRPRP